MLVAKKIFVWNKGIIRSGKNVGMHDVDVKPIRMVFGFGGLKAFSFWMQCFGKELEQKSSEYPIIVDRLYKLKDIEHALEYAENESDDLMLGEHIGISINKVDENEIETMLDEKAQNIKQWKPMQLINVKKYKQTSMGVIKTLSNRSE